MSRDVLGPNPDVLDSDRAVVNVGDDFEAQGGVDEYVKFQAALNAVAPYGTVVVPPPLVGTEYVTSQGLTIAKPGIRIVSDGMVTIRQATWGRQIFDVQEVPDCSFEGLDLRCTQPRIYYGNPNYRSDAGYLQAAGIWSNGDRTKVNRCRARGFVCGVYLTNWKQSAGAKSGYVRGGSVTNLDVEDNDFGLLAIGQDLLTVENIKGTYLSSVSNVTATADTTFGSAVVTTAGIVNGPFYAGQVISGPGIPVGAKVLSVAGGNTSITLDVNATAGATGVTITGTGNAPNAPHIVYITDNQPNKHVTVENVSGVDSPGTGGNGGHVVSFKGVTGGRIDGVYGDNCAGLVTIKDCLDIEADNFVSRNDANDGSDNGALFVQGGTNERIEIGTVSIHMADDSRAVRVDGADVTIDDLKVYANHGGALAGVGDVVISGTRNGVNKLKVINRGAGGWRAAQLTTPGSGCFVRDLTAVGCNIPGKIDVGHTNGFVWHRGDQITPAAGGTRAWVNSEPTAKVLQLALHASDRPVLPQVQGWKSIQGALTASRSFFYRFTPQRRYDATLLGYILSVSASVDDQIDWGVYDAAGVAIQRAGATSGKLNVTAGTKTLALVQAFEAGITYYIGFAQGTIGGTAAQIELAEWLPGAGAGTRSGAGAGVADIIVTASQFPLPTNITFVGSSAAQGPALSIRES